MTSWVYWENTSSVCPRGTRLDPCHAGWHVHNDAVHELSHAQRSPQGCSQQPRMTGENQSIFCLTPVGPILSGRPKKKGDYSCYKNSKHATVLETLAWFLKISSWNIPPLIGLHMLPKCYNDRNDSTNSWNWPPHGGNLRSWKRTSMAIPAGWHLWKTCTFNGDLMVI